MSDYPYSREVADLVLNFLENDGWNFYFDEKKGIFRFDVGIESRLNGISFNIHLALGGILILASSPVSTNPDDEIMMARMAEYLTRVNYDISMGNFEMDYDDGETRYRFYIDTDNGLPSDGVIREGIMTGINLFEKVDEGLLGIIFKDMSAKQAYHCWKDCYRRQITRKLLEKAVSQGEDEEFIEFLESFLDEEEPDKKPGDLN